MKKTIISIAVLVFLVGNSAVAQKAVAVPAIVKSTFIQKYPDAKKVTWEKENGNYEANWGGKSGEDNSVIYTPAGKFVEIAKAIPITQLPAPVTSYVKKNYKNAKITEAALVTDASGKVSYEAEVNHHDIVFDQQGNFIKKE